MANRDPHQALTSEVIGHTRSTGIEVKLARLQWSKAEIGYSLHVTPSQYTTAGIQLTDFLAMLSFSRSVCSFSGRSECYWKWVDEGFEVTAFLAAFDGAYKLMEQAEGAFERCGYMIPRTEGWGYFYGKRSEPGRGYGESLSGDGHTGAGVRLIGKSEDAIFQYQFTFLDTGRNKGWVTHYRPKHLPLSAELESVFKFLGLRRFDECPQFDFESCYFRTTAFVARGDGVFDNNTEWANSAFNAHVQNFSPALEKFLAANSEMEKVGMSILPIPSRRDRQVANMTPRIIRPAPKMKPGTVPGSAGRVLTLDSALPDKFDVAISVAGPEREHAAKLAEILKGAGFVVFYDELYPEHMWGKDLAAFLDGIYRQRARYCAVFVSKAYKASIWTSHEMRSAQARAVKEKGNDYILPIKVDNTELEGLPETIAYIELGKGVDYIGDLLVKKLKG